MRYMEKRARRVVAGNNVAVATVDHTHSVLDSATTNEALGATTICMLNALTAPVLVLDSGLDIVFANRAAESLRHGDLRTGGRVDGASMRALLETVAEEGISVSNVEIVDASERVITVSARPLQVPGILESLIVVELQESDTSAEKRRLTLRGEPFQERQNGGATTDLEWFAQFASHDLRTPIRFIRKIAELVLSAHGDAMPADARSKIAMIADCTEEMSALVEDLLTVSRIGSQPLRRELLDMQSLVRDVLTELQDECQGRHVSIITGELPRCRANAGLVKQVYLNILGNALKYSREREHAKIHIGCIEHNGENIYYIRDNGVGFDAARADALFQPYCRLANAESYEGSGLGMALVKRIIERHDGRVWADGRLSKGAAFYFTLESAAS